VFFIEIYYYIWLTFGVVDCLYFRCIIYEESKFIVFDSHTYFLLATNN